MLSRIVPAAGRARNSTVVVKRLHALLSQPCAISRRSVSLWPRKSTQHQPPLPVYFPVSPHRVVRWKRAIGWVLGLRRSLFLEANRYRRFVFTAVTLTLCAHIFVGLVLEPLIDWAEKEWDTLSEEEKQELENESGGKPWIFLPCPFTTKEVQQPPYNKTGPPADVVMALSRDPQLQEKLKYQLAAIIRRATERNPGLQRALGGNEFKIERYWLDMIFPERPPPVYYVSGIFIDEESIGWGVRPIDITAAKRLSMVVYPEAALQAAWTFLHRFFSQAAQDIAETMNFKQPAPNPGDENVGRSFVLRRIGPAAGGQIHSPHRQAARGVTQPATLSSLPANTAGGAQESFPFQKTQGMQPQSPLESAMQASMVTFKKHWRPVSSQPHPSAIRTDGLIQLRGSSGTMVAQVQAWLDLSKSQFVDIRLSIKQVKVNASSNLIK